MRISAQILSVVACFFLAFFLFQTPAYAQEATQPSPSTVQSSSSTNNFLMPNADPDVPQNHHSMSQVVLIDMLSAIMCQLTGVDPTDPSQACLGVDPSTGKIGLVPSQDQQTFGQANDSPQVGGTLGIMAQSIGSLYTPAISTTQYVSYLSSNFGIVKPTFAANNTNQNCNNNPFGYTFCGLSPILTLWSDVRDLAYALLTVLFIAIGIGVMVRFRVDPRTVMTLQNQIPRVIVAILLITFSFAIAGALGDIMWTVTYAGVNFIANASPASQVALCPPGPQPLNRVVETRLLDQPISFTNTVFRSQQCGGVGTIDNGLLTLSDKISSSAGDLVQQLLHDLFVSNLGGSCHVNWWTQSLASSLITKAKCAVADGALSILLWITEQIAKLIFVIVMLIALFRLWFKLIQCYLTFLIFVIMGPIWIVLGLIPGRPMGFEKWLRIVFANLAVFPLVAFILVFARVIVDVTPAAGPTLPNSFFVPPLIGNPNLATFSALMGFGAIMIAPNIPDLIKERMKATGQAKYGAMIAGGLAAGTAVATSPGRRTWESLNRRNPQTGQPEGILAVKRQKYYEKLPLVGRAAFVNRTASHMAYNHPEANYEDIRAEQNAKWHEKRGNQPKADAIRQKVKDRTSKAQLKGARPSMLQAYRSVLGRNRTQGAQPPTPQTPPTPGNTGNNGGGNGTGGNDNTGNT